MCALNGFDCNLIQNFFIHTNRAAGAHKTMTLNCRLFFPILIKYARYFPPSFLFSIANWLSILKKKEKKTDEATIEQQSIFSLCVNSFAHLANEKRYNIYKWMSIECLPNNGMNSLWSTTHTHTHHGESVTEWVSWLCNVKSTDMHANLTKKSLKKIVQFNFVFCGGFTDGNKPGTKMNLKLKFVMNILLALVYKILQQTIDSSWIEAKTNREKNEHNRLKYPKGFDLEKLRRIENGTGLNYSKSLSKCQSEVE